MKKLLVLVALLAVAASPSFAQITGPYLVDYFSNNSGYAPTDSLTFAPIQAQQVRLVNFGLNGTPLTSPVGDVCANIYVFDAAQEMVECCSCRITPNGLLTLSVGYDLTNNPVTAVVPINGDVKIVSTIAGATCTPLTYNGGLTDSIVGFGTHLQAFGIGGAPANTYINITETNIPAAQLSALEQGFLTQACQFARYLGSGKGVCSCAAIG